MKDALPGTNDEITARYADMLAALGAEPRLRIVRLLLAAHPEGLVVGEIGAELGIPPSTLSHHLDKLKNEASSRSGARARSFATPRRRDASGNRRIPVRRVLHPQQGDPARSHHLRLPIGEAPCRDRCQEIVRERTPRRRGACKPALAAAPARNGTRSRPTSTPTRNRRSARERRAGVARLRQSDRARRTEGRRDRARPRLRRRHRRAALRAARRARPARPTAST